MRASVYNVSSSDVIRISLLIAISDSRLVIGVLLELQGSRHLLTHLLIPPRSIDVLHAMTLEDDARGFKSTSSWD